MAFLAWALFACLVWRTAISMLLTPRTRRTALPLTLAMAATFPSVLLFQLAAAPVVGGVLLAVHLLWKALEPGTSTTTSHPVVIIASMVAMVSAFAVMLGMSVLGFFEGWRIGWSCGKGQRLRDAIDHGPSALLLYPILRNKRPGR